MIGFTLTLVRALIGLAADARQQHATVATAAVIAAMRTMPVRVTA